MSGNRRDFSWTAVAIIFTLTAGCKGPVTEVELGERVYVPAINIASGGFREAVYLGGYRLEVSDENVAAAKGYAPGQHPLSCVLALHEAAMANDVDAYNARTLVTLTAPIGENGYALPMSKWEKHFEKAGVRGREDMIQWRDFLLPDEGKPTPTVDVQWAFGSDFIYQLGERPYMTSPIRLVQEGYHKILWDEAAFSKLFSDSIEFRYPAGTYVSEADFPRKDFVCVPIEREDDIAPTELCLKAFLPEQCQQVAGFYEEVKGLAEKAAAEDAEARNQFLNLVSNRQRDTVDEYIENPRIVRDPNEQWNKLRDYISGTLEVILDDGEGRYCLLIENPVNKNGWLDRVWVTTDDAALRIDNFLAAGSFENFIERDDVQAALRTAIDRLNGEGQTEGAGEKVGGK